MQVKVQSPYEQGVLNYADNVEVILCNIRCVHFCSAMFKSHCAMLFEFLAPLHAAAFKPMQRVCKCLL